MVGYTQAVQLELIPLHVHIGAPLELVKVVVVRIIEGWSEGR